MKQITIDQDTYKIQDIDNSTWKRVYKNSEFLALVIGCETARQVIFNNVGDGVILTENDFKEIV